MDTLQTYWQQFYNFYSSFYFYVAELATLFDDSLWFKASIIATMAFILGKLASYALPNLLNKFSKLIKFGLGEKIISWAIPPIFYFFFINGLQISVRIMEFSETIEFALIASLKSLMIIILAVFILKLSKLLLQLAAKNKNAFKIIQPQTLPLFNNLSVIIIALGTAHRIFSSWDVDMTALMASAGILGLAIGMAARDTLADVISGVLILTDAPYRVGDTIALDNGIRGEINQIGIRSTRLITSEHVLITIPNGTMGKSEVVNESGGKHPHRRMNIDLRLPYGIDLKEVKEILTELALECEWVLKDPMPKAVVQTLETERLHFCLQVWIASPQHKSDTTIYLNEAIYLRFMQENIPIFTEEKYDIAIKEVPTQTMRISDIPNLFGQSTAKGLCQTNDQAKTLKNNDTIDSNKSRKFNGKVKWSPELRHKSQNLT